MSPKAIDESWLAGPINRSLDDAKKKIEKAIHRKRKQTRQSSIPVILAINMDGMGASYEDFDQVLFGYTWYHANWGTFGFKANGLFTGRATKKESPTFAGILAFFNVGLWGWKDNPILYINFMAELPNGLLRLERRLYDSEKNTIVRVKTQCPDLRKEMLFAIDG